MTKKSLKKYRKSQTSRRRFDEVVTDSKLNLEHDAHFHFAQQNNGKWLNYILSFSGPKTSKLVLVTEWVKEVLVKIIISQVWLSA